MKLLYQLNAAFAMLLIIIMSVTAFFIYTLLLDMLIKDEQQELQENGEFLLNIMYEEESVPTGPLLASLIGNDDFRVLFFDPEHNDILFSTLPKDIAKQWSQVFEKDEPHKTLWKSGEDTYVTTKIPYQYNGKFYLLIMATPLEELRSLQSVFAIRMIVIFIIGIFVAVLFSYILTNRLITPLSQLKREVKKVKNRQFDAIERIHAEGEIGEVEQSVFEMAKELERYIETQKQFFQNASHELKTPLMTIQGYAEGVKDGVFKGEAADRSLDVIVKESERLKKIVNEIILLAKLDSEEGIYTRDFVQLSELVEQTRERLLPVANDYHVSMEINILEDATLQLDQEKVLQALINIGGNGIRHAHQAVTLTTYKQRHSYVIEVADDGEGIAEDLLPQLFHRFVKGKSGETGLGLAISRAIIERTGGTIRVYNREEGGAVFEVRLPL
ncbi:sensor histidine kinase [Pontibacillus litoralis]|uniref:histidine kinase n=1 Tax=Pontibacillus litoralis JSM 072002 TaxID=1385512 RepID=A0A0A5G7Y8_9BACI|nr:HAMP domain-containing sensor histidine kinase [Pontibacillus litoralis]KGX87220.1 histidine kinase [Pontibacillus litoralis JSM 072002]